MEKNLKTLSFYPNSCTYCHAYGKDADLTICDKCLMSSYCKGRHHEEYERQHKTICIAIQNVFREKVFRILRKARDMTLQQWIWLRRTMLLSVAKYMDRPMFPFEIEMFMFPKACIVCYRQEGKLTNCSNCPNVSFCPKHIGIAVHTEEMCVNFQLCHVLETNSDWHRNYACNIDDDIQCLSDSTFIRTMADICSINVKLKNETDTPVKIRVPVKERKLNEAIYSVYVSCPMSVFYGWEKLKYSPSDKEVVVHIVDTNLPYIICKWSWEILFHLIPTITSLEIIIINSAVSQMLDFRKLCKNCKPLKKIVFKNYEMPYEDYVRNEIIFKKPDVIVGYNMNLMTLGNGVEQIKMYKSLRTIRTVLDLECPFILLSPKNLSMEREKEALNTYFTMLEKRMKLVYHGNNPFASIKPVRDMETLGAYFTNSYLLVYKNISS